MTMQRRISLRRQQKAGEDCEHRPFVYIRKPNCRSGTQGRPERLLPAAPGPRISAALRPGRQWRVGRGRLARSRVSDSRIAVRGGAKGCVTASAEPFPRSGRRRLPAPAAVDTTNESDRFLLLRLPSHALNVETTGTASVGFTRRRTIFSATVS